MDPPVQLPIVAVAETKFSSPDSVSERIAFHAADGPRLVTSAVYVTRPPSCTGFGEATTVSDTSAAVAVATVRGSTELVARFPSRWSLRTVAVLMSVPGLVVVTIIRTVTVSPGPIALARHWTTWLSCGQSRGGKK